MGRLEIATVAEAIFKIMLEVGGGNSLVASLK
jgi:hypothetical protein